LTIRQVPQVRPCDYAILADRILLVDPVAKTVIAVIN